MFNCLLWSRYRAKFHCTGTMQLSLIQPFHHCRSIWWVIRIGVFTDILVTYPFQDAGHSKQSGWGDFCLIWLDGRHEVLRGIVETLGHLAEPLRVRRPQHNDLVASWFAPEYQNTHDTYHIPILIQVSETEGSGTNGQYSAVFGLIIWYCIPYLKSLMSARTCSTCSHLSFVSMTLSALSSWGSIQLNFDRFFKRSFNKASTDLIGYCDTI